jgi:hypothetical protein
MPMSEPLAFLLSKKVLSNNFKNQHNDAVDIVE